MSHGIHHQGFLLTLGLLFICSCNPSPEREWILVNTITKRPCYNSSRLFLEPDSKAHHIELEISRSRSGINMYLNLMLFPAPPLPDDPSRTSAEFIVEGEEPIIFYPYRLSGDQRLLIPDDMTQQMIALLTSEKSFVIKMGRDEIQVVPDNFQISYDNLLTIPIE